MRIYDIAFYSAGFFILGVLALSFEISFSVVIMAAFLAAALFLLIAYLKNIKILFWFAGFSLIIIFGAFYYSAWDGYQIKNINVVFDKKINFTGMVVQNPKRGDSQQLVVKLQEPFSGNILARVQPYPSFDYGDKINFEGVVKKPEPLGYADYLSKDGIFGVISFPKTELIAINQGSNIKAALFKFKEKIILSFQKALAPEKAAFISGLTLGERAEFSDEFKSAMKNSGTTHLVALSGYNISVIVVALGLFLSHFLSRRLTFILTTLTILIFVLMTGAEASVVRAAIMGFIVLLASQVSRLYSIRNAVVLAAFFMIIANPKVLRFDIGFQLSFVALLGIVYLSPAIKKFFRISDDSDTLSLKENFFTTFSAQLAVFPILASSFGVVSFVSLLANTLILSVIPVTMSLGFILAGLGFISNYLAFIFGWFINLFLSYEIFVINLFGKLNVLQIDSFNLFFAAVYYFLLIIFVFFVGRCARSKRGN